MNKKLAIFLLGGGAAGKSTTTRAFVKGTADKYSAPMYVNTRHGQEIKRITWTLFDNCGVAGTYQSGSDANNGPGAQKAAWLECLKERDVVIIDGRIGTPQWAVMAQEWQDEHPEIELGLLLVHFDITEDEMLRRLANRRATSIEEVEYMRKDCPRQLAMPFAQIKHFENLSNLPTTILKVWDGDSTDEIIKFMLFEISEYFDIMSFQINPLPFCKIGL